MKDRVFRQLWLIGLFFSILLQTLSSLNAQSSPIIVKTMQGANSWNLVSGQTVEVTLGTTTVVPGTTTAQLQKTFTVVNNSGVSKVFSLTVPVGFATTTVLSPTTVVAGGSATFAVGVIPSKEGLRSGTLQVIAGTDRFLFQIGAMVWPKNGQSLNPVPFNAPPPSPSPNPNLKISSELPELISLTSARSASDYRAIRSSLKLRAYETSILTLTPRIGELIIGANRSAFSPGAREAYEQDLSAMSNVSVRDQLNMLNKIIMTLKNDKSAEGRLAALTVFNQLSEVISGLLPAFRLYLTAQLTPGLIAYFPELNAAGKVYLLQGFIRSYLKTNPPVTEALQIIDPLVRTTVDPVVKTALVKMTLGTYPSKFSRPSSVASTTAFNPEVPLNLGAGAVCRGGTGNQTCKPGLTCATHNLCSPPGPSLSPRGEMCRTGTDCIPGTACVLVGSARICQ